MVHAYITMTDKDREINDINAKIRSDAHFEREYNNRINIYN
ncbi:4128_t:CDS:2 [Entrophospora sp. SA101]|nr:10601_t:CDS:2 [Entrophospora sp. SA101]CAJ0643800.1 4128_t:CDS:2 [Entrophospora sp. SA101]CAJ0834526.1 1848_t:CDS:2 [Entrophospora sp. SA101]